MTDIVDFLHCSFCGRSSTDANIDFIIRSSLSKQACVCNNCIAKLYILMQNSYAGMHDDQNNYNLD